MVRSFHTASLIEYSVGGGCRNISYDHWMREPISAFRRHCDGLTFSCGAQSCGGRNEELSFCNALFLAFSIPTSSWLQWFREALHEALHPHNFFQGIRIQGSLFFCSSVFVWDQGWPKPCCPIINLESWSPDVPPSRFSGDEIWIAYLEVFASACQEGDHQKWTEHFLATPVEVVLDPTMSDP